MILLTFIIHRGVFIIHHLYSTYTTYSSEKVIPSKYPPHGHSLHHNRWCFFCLTQEVMLRCLKSRNKQHGQ